MATSLRMIFPSILIAPSSQPSTDRRRPAGLRRLTRGGSGGGRWRAMVQQQQAYQGSAANYAKEMERLSAKESLLLAFKDAGGFQSLVSGKTTELHRIDVNERIVGLERLNPTPRPTTSPFLEGRWNFEWFGSGSPGLFAARFLFERFPVTLANLVGLDMLIKDGYSKGTANMKFLTAVTPDKAIILALKIEKELGELIDHLNVIWTAKIEKPFLPYKGESIESKFLLTTKLSVEGPLRMKEEYVDGVFETPTVSEQAIPEQLKGAVGQATGSLQQLPAPIKDAVGSGLKLPLGGTFQRLFMISYLDEEILIIRDSGGAPDVLTRLEGPPPPLVDETIATEYES